VIAVPRSREVTPVIFNRAISFRHDADPLDDQFWPNELRAPFGDLRLWLASGSAGSPVLPSRGFARRLLLPDHHVLAVEGDVAS